MLYCQADSSQVFEIPKWLNRRSKDACRFVTSFYIFIFFKCKKNNLKESTKYFCHLLLKLSFIVVHKMSNSKHSKHKNIHFHKAYTNIKFQNINKFVI